jgi:capsular polysaccharide biosynthesis protein
VWGGWGHGHDVGDGPRLAEAHTANRSHPTVTDPEVRLARGVGTFHFAAKHPTPPVWPM